MRGKARDRLVHLRRSMGFLVLVCALTQPAAAEDPGRSLADLLLFWPGIEARAETEEEQREEFIETDRNSFTFSPFAPGPGRWVFESAYSYLNFGREGARHSFPEAIVRYGVGDRLELRFGYNFELGRAAEVGEGNIAGGFGINAEQQILYGFKYATTRQRDDIPWLPHSAVLAQAHTPVGSLEGQTQGRWGYVWGYVLPNGWTFDQAARFGTDREDEDGYALIAPSAVLRIPFGAEKRWFTHIEYFSALSSGRERNFNFQFIDTGLHYFITPNWEIGTIVAFGVNDPARGIIINFGSGIRF